MICDECGYRTAFDDDFILGGDDVFRCVACNDEREKVWTAPELRVAGAAAEEFGEKAEPI